MQNICLTQICFTDSAHFLSFITVLHIRLKHERIACIIFLFRENIHENTKQSSWTKKNIIRNAAW